MSRDTVHLLVADDALIQGHRTSTYVAAWGEPVSTLRDPLGLTCDPTYCQSCVRAAVAWSAAGPTRGP